ncbi:copper resistance CopC family protein [Mycobacterium sp. shizuoka-1]|uniref:copper resistance CopC family protein n=1 Tax=Mycobacterium sp. shizuoka-1 TaxID=2039281 RepID=UPI000C065F69|nr:copper resistance CopC family protein [Mycobacterium sp. shizuoka-1]GAY19246.1 hypothetical protein MSZK_59720 [Mycobacterium sp. shizuoka-1]
MTLTLRVVVTTLFALFFWSWSSAVAAAHTTLVSSDPANDAQVSTPLSAVVLTFSEDINPAFATVVVHSADGHDWVTAPARVDGPRLTAEVGPAPLPNGKYTVGYRVVSADGHPVSGSYTFTVAGTPDQPSTPAVTSSAAAPSTTAAPAASTESSGPDTRTSILTAAAAGLAVGGVIAFWQSRKRRRNNAGGGPDSAGS